MIIRQSTPSDINNIYSFLLDIIPESYAYIAGGSLFKREFLKSDPDYLSYVQETYQNNQTNTCILLEEDGAIRGLIALKSLQDSTYEIHSLYIEHGYRGRGHATQLLKKIETYIPKPGASVIDVITSNQPAIIFWEKMGFDAISGYIFPFRWDQWREGSSVMMQRYEKYYN